MNGITKWLLGVMLALILAGAGWNENKQWQMAEANSEKTQQNSRDIAALRSDVATVKEIAGELKQTAISNSEKNDKILRKLDAILEQRK